MSDKELQELLEEIADVEIMEHHPELITAVKDKFIAIVREHDLQSYEGSFETMAIDMLRADERRRCIGAVEELLGRTPNGLVNYGIIICLEALGEQE